MNKPLTAYRLPTYWISKPGEADMKINQFDYPQWRDKGWTIKGERRGDAPPEIVKFHEEQARIEEAKRRDPTKMAFGDTQRAYEGRAIEVTGQTAQALRAVLSETDGTTGGDDAAKPATVAAPAPPPPQQAPAQPEPVSKLPPGTVVLDALPPKQEGGAIPGRNKASGKSAKGASSDGKKAKSKEKAAAGSGT